MLDNSRYEKLSNEQDKTEDLVWQLLGVFDFLGNYDTSFPVIGIAFVGLFNRYLAAYNRNSNDFIRSFGKDGK